MATRFWVETLGCPKNQVDSEKLVGRLETGGMVPADAPGTADLVVVNTCAFVEDARRESIDVVLDLAEARREGARLVVTGCLAERYRDDLATELPEVDTVAGFGVAFERLSEHPVGRAAEGVPAAVSAVAVAAPRRRPQVGHPEIVPDFDLLNLPRPASQRPWAYLKIAEGCDRSCGFCAIPSFRGPQRSRPIAEVLAEVDALGVREVVLVAQDLASYGRDGGTGERALGSLIGAVAERVDRVRCLYLYPADLTDSLADAICATGVPYFDLSLQHVSAELLRRMRRWGDGERFARRIATIREREPEAAFRSNFIVGYPGETEADHDELLRFVERTELDWCGFFAYSEEEGTHSAGLDGKVAAGLAAERLAELTELQDGITARRRDRLVGRTVEVLVDEPGVGRSHREAPEIDGIVAVPGALDVGSFARVEVVGSAGPDLEARTAVG